MIVNRYAKPAMRTLRTERSAAAERQSARAPLALDGILDLYFGGSMKAGYAMSGQVAGRIDAVLPVRRILEETWRDCQARLRELGARADVGLSASLGVGSVSLRLYPHDDLDPAAAVDELRPRPCSRSRPASTG